MKKFILLLSILIIGTWTYGNEISTFTLDNGQTVIIKEVHTNPIVTIDTWIKTGSINESDKNNGISHFLEHLFFKGTSTHPTGEFDQILESKGAVTNAATSKDFTHYYITLPSKDFNLAIELHADMLQNPLIPRKELEQERKVVLEEISKDLNTPSSLTYDNLMQILYKNHPYKRKVIGTSTVIEQITREEILNYFKQYYPPSNMITVIVGDIDTTQAINEIKKNFTSNNNKIKIKNNLKEKPLTSYSKKEDYTDTQTGYMLIGFRCPDINNMYALDILATLLGESESSIFSQTIKNKKQLAFSISASNLTFKEDDLFAISANFIPDNYQILEENIFNEIKKIQTNGITDSQLKLAKSIIEQNTYYSRESISDIAEEIGYSTLITGDKKYYDKYLQNIKKVSKKDVQNAAKKYLSKDNAAVSVVLPKNYSQQENIKPLKESQIPSTIVKQTKETTKYKLGNNSILLYTPNTDNDIIAISIKFKGGEFIEKVPGTAKIFSEVLLTGTKKYSSEELVEFLDKNGIKITATSKPDYFTINILTTKPQYNNTLEILDEIINNTLLDNSEIERIKTNAINLIQKKRDLALYKALEAENTLIFENSVYSNSTKVLEKTYPTIKRNDIFDYYNKIFTPENTIISINGNVDCEKSVQKFTHIFKNNNENSFDYTKILIPNIKSPKTSEIVDKNTQTDWILLSWQTNGILNLKDCATLSVINSLLGSGMSSRLFRDLREQEGLAYQLGSNFQPNLKRGKFIVYIGTNHKNLSLAKTKLFEEINKLKTEYVTTKELQEAKDKLHGQLLLSKETNLEKATLKSYFEFTGLGFDGEDEFEKLIDKVTESDIIEIANKYFNNNYVLSIVKNK